MNERHLELSDYYRVFYSGRWYIILTLLMSLAFTIYLNGKLEPVYRTTATIMIKSNASEGSIFLNQEFDLPAKMEDQLDAISRGEEKWVPMMKEFWQPLKDLVADKDTTFFDDFNISNKIR